MKKKEEDEEGEGFLGAKRRNIKRLKKNFFKKKRMDE